MLRIEQQCERLLPIERYFDPRNVAYFELIRDRRDGAVTNFKLGSGVVTHSKLGANVVDSSNVVTNSLTLYDILGANIMMGRHGQLPRFRQGRFHWLVCNR